MYKCAFVALVSKCKAGVGKPLDQDKFFTSYKNISTTKSDLIECEYKKKKKNHSSAGGD
jgi:hypothetical protein